MIKLTCFEKDINENTLINIEGMQSTEKVIEFAKNFIENNKEKDITVFSYNPIFLHALFYYANKYGVIIENNEEIEKVFESIYSPADFLYEFHI
jgi:hypothetical protein